MSKSTLQVRSRECDADTCVYELTGRLYGTRECYDFQDLVRGKMAAGTRKFIIDLHGVDHIDSSGLGILLGLTISAYNCGGGMIFTAMRSRVKTLFDMLRVLDRIEHADSMDDAVARLKHMDLPRKDQ